MNLPVINIPNKVIRTVLLGVLLISCTTTHAAEINIAVASNFAATMKQLVTEFEKSTAHRVNLAVGSSGKFYAQIMQGAPFHAFFSADRSKPLALEQAGLILPDSRFTYAVGALALWSKTPGFIDQELTQVHANNFRKLALANPRHAPYGVASVEVLETLGLKEATQNKWVLGENIAQTLQFVSTGNADLGFIALSQLHQNNRNKQGSWWLVSSEMHQPIYQDAVLLPAAKSNPAAHKLMQFIRSENAQKIIQRFGYSSGSSQPASQ